MKYEICQKFQQFFLVRWTTVTLGGTLICKYYEPFKLALVMYSMTKRHKNKTCAEKDTLLDCFYFFVLFFVGGK